MREEQRNSTQARFFVIITSLLAAAVVWIAVVKAVGYSVLAGFFYFAAYFVAMILFLTVLGYSHFEQSNENE